MRLPAHICRPDIDVEETPLFIIYEQSDFSFQGVCHAFYGIKQAARPINTCASSYEFNSDRLSDRLSGLSETPAP